MSKKQDRLIADVRLMGDDVLKEKCKPVDEITPEIKQLAEHMLDVMYASSGCGLAAPQVGRNIRMIVIDCEYAGNSDNYEPYVLINPEIIEESKEKVTNEEGCLSFPGITVDIKRPMRVVVQALNLNGELMQYEASDSLMARCLQHEIDHLDGITMLDYLGPFARMRAIEDVKEAIEERNRK